MKLRLFFSRLSCPVFCLAMLLQRSPLVRYLAQLEHSLIPRVQHIWTVVVGAVTVGAYNTVTGATGDLRFRSNQDDTQVSIGEELTLVIEVEGSLTPETWVVPEPNQLPAGVTASFNVSFGIATISGTPTESGSFPVTIQAWQNRNMGGDKAPDFSFIITVDPFITQQPVAQEINVGESIQLSVLVGDSTGVSYQWQRQDPNNGDVFNNLEGETGASLSIANATLADSGIYRVLASKDAFQEISNEVVVAVNSLIAEQPADQVADWGGDAEFSLVMVSPEGVTYQWQKQNVEDPGVFDDLVGQTSASLNLTNVTSKDAGSYRVVATSGEVVEISEVGVLSVNVSPLQSWLETYFEDPFGEDTALDQDPDKDTLNNAVEFTFGLDPNAKQQEALVRTTQEAIEGVVHAVYIFPPLSGGSTTSVSLEGNATPDAAGWTTMVNGVDGVIIESTAEAYVVKLPADIRQFNRLRIIENES